MIFRDDELKELEAHGLPALPPADVCGHVTNDGARLWFQAFGAGAPVVLLHGGLGHGGNWAHQVPALVAAGWRPIVIDSRGHGRSTMGPHTLSYSLMASDLLAVMDHLTLKRAPIVGWSDGADTGLIAARDTPRRISGLFFFACNVDGSGTKPFVMTPVIERIFATHKRNYSELSPEPSEFERLMQTTETMQRSQPNLSADDIRGITVPVTVAIGEDDEFITRDHMVYLADTLPHGTLRILDGVTHFAPLQRPNLFKRALLEFLDRQTPAAYF